MGRERVSGKRLTIAEIATMAGVSKPTVSKVLNGRSDVSAATRERVERVMAAQGYVPNRAARGLGRGRTALIDLVMLELGSPYIGQVILGVEEALEEVGYSMVVTATHDQAQRQRQWLTRVIEHATEGAILVLPDGQTAHLEELRRRHIPFVVVDDRGERAPDTPSVGATNFAGGLAATEYLISLGHRRIAAIGGRPYGCTRARLAGYRTALEEAGIPYDPRLVQPGDFELDGGYRATMALLDLPDPPTAIFAGNDSQAIGAYKALHARGLRVPDDMSVIGFDDVPLAALVQPALTTIRQPLKEMGALAVAMLLRLIAGRELESLHIELATTLVTRESCAPPKHAGSSARPPQHERRDRTAQKG